MVPYYDSLWDNDGFYVLKKKDSNGRRSKKRAHVPLRISGVNEYSEEYIAFERERSDMLEDYDRYSDFIKKTEQVIRLDDRYTRYISKLKKNGLDRCAIMGNMPDAGSKLKVEMHHGPIFNLFDLCDIVLKASLLRGEDDITSFDISDRILTEHENDHIMIVMLSKPVHMGGAHNKRSHKSIFIDITATFGRLDRFIDNWGDGMEEEHFTYIRKYCEACRAAQGHSLDQGLFDVADRLASYK